VLSMKVVTLRWTDVSRNGQESSLTVRRLAARAIRIDVRIEAWWRTWKAFSMLSKWLEHVQTACTQPLACRNVGMP
jgi:hypothetical protein